MALTIQDDMIEAAELLPEEDQKDFYYALVQFSKDKTEPDYSDLKPWHVAFKTCMGRVKLSSEMRELGKRGAEARWNKTPVASANIAKTENAIIAECQNGIMAESDSRHTSRHNGENANRHNSPAIMLSRVEKSRNEMSTGEKRLEEEREEEKEKEKIKKKKNEKETREESGEGVSDGNVAGANPTERLVKAWTFGTTDSVR